MCSTSSSLADVGFDHVRSDNDLQYNEDWFPVEPHSLLSVVRLQLGIAPDKTLSRLPPPTDIYCLHLLFQPLIPGTNMPNLYIKRTRTMTFRFIDWLWSPKQYASIGSWPRLGCPLLSLVLYTSRGIATTLSTGS